MKIKFDVSIAGVNYNYDIGDTAEMPKSQAIRLCKAGIAHPLKEKDIETQVERPNETANKNYPRHKGGGYYILSNGDQVRGKEKAQKAERQLKE